MKSIIVATDFSVNGDNAMRYAVNAAYRSGARLVLLTQYTPSLYKLNASVSASSRDDLLETQTIRLAAAKEVITRTYALAVEFHLASGNFVRDVKECIDIYGASTLVVGMAKNALEKDLLPETVMAGECCHGSADGFIRANPTGVKNIFFCPEMLQDMHYNLLNKVKNFAWELGATIDHFQI